MAIAEPRQVLLLSSPQALSILEVVMPWKRNVLVVANVTATSRDLLNALVARAEREKVAFTLIVPATPFGGGRAAAAAQLDEALAHLREAGLEADGSVGPGDPISAVIDVWDPKRYDEILVSTLPLRLSKWLHAGLPARIERLTGAPVTHIVSEPPKPAVQTVPPPAHERLGVTRPLSVMYWGGQKQP
jgi:hypothetical protein